jgi:hypothetical protein
MRLPEMKEHKTTVVHKVDRKELVAAQTFDFPRNRGMRAGKNGGKTATYSGLTNLLKVVRRIAAPMAIALELVGAAQSEISRIAVHGKITAARLAAMPQPHLEKPRPLRDPSRGVHSGPSRAGLSTDRIVGLFTPAWLRSH